MIKERIIQLIEYKGIGKEFFYQKIGMTSANFRGNAKKTPINSNAIENILSEIPDVNLEWLLTGKGTMLKTATQEGPAPKDRQKEIDRLLELLDQKDQEIAKLKKANKSQYNLGYVAENPGNFELKKPKK